MTRLHVLLISALLAVLGLLAPAAPALALMIQCDGCDDLAMQQRIRDLAAAGIAVSGATHVADFSGNVLRSYEVACHHWGWPHGGPGDAGSRPGGAVRWWACTQMTIEPAATPSTALEQYAVLREFYLDTGGSWQKQVVPPVLAEWQLVGPFGGHIRNFTAFDVAGDMNGRVLLGGALTNHCILCGLPQIGLLVNALASVVINAPAAVIVTVRFRDGSTARYVYQFNQNWQFTYVPGSALTADGQLIPDVGSLGTVGNASWYFGPGGGGDLIGYFERVRPGFVGPAPPGGQSYRLECSWDGQTLTCRILPP
jgi:hypothetical protein